MKKNELIDILFSFLKKFIEENEIETFNDITHNTRLIGSESIFDSIDLVTFIVQLEQELNINYDYNLQLADEKAMSRRTSPFINLDTLSNYIKELIDE